MQNRTAMIESILEISYKVQYIFIIWFSSPTPRHLPNEIQMHIDTKSRVQIFWPHFHSHPTWKQPQYPSAGEWINCAINLYNGLSNKKEETIDKSTTSCISNAKWKEATCCLIPYKWHPGKGKTAEAESRSVVARGVGGGADNKDTGDNLGRWLKCSISWLRRLLDCMCLSKFTKEPSQRANTSQFQNLTTTYNSTRRHEILRILNRLDFTQWIISQ